MCVCVRAYVLCMCAVRTCANLFAEGFARSETFKAGVASYYDSRFPGVVIPPEAKSPSDGIKPDFDCKEMEECLLHMAIEAENKEIFDSLLRYQHFGEQN